MVDSGWNLGSLGSGLGLSHCLGKSRKVGERQQLLQAARTSTPPPSVTLSLGQHFFCLKATTSTIGENMARARAGLREGQLVPAEQLCIKSHPLRRANWSQCPQAKESSDQARARETPCKGEMELM